ILGNGGALPTGVPVGAGPGVRLACGPAVEDGEAKLNVIDLGGDGGLAGHWPRRGGSRVDRVELAEQAGLTRVKEVRRTARRAVEDLGQHVGQGGLEDRVGGSHLYSSWVSLSKLGPDSFAVAIVPKSR